MRSALIAAAGVVLLLALATPIAEGRGTMSFEISATFGGTGRIEGHPAGRCEPQAQTLLTETYHAKATYGTAAVGTPTSDSKTRATLTDDVRATDTDRCPDLTPVPPPTTTCELKAKLGDGREGGVLVRTPISGTGLDVDTTWPAASLSGVPGSCTPKDGPSAVATPAFFALEIQTFDHISAAHVKEIDVGDTVVLKTKFPDDEERSREFGFCQHSSGCKASMTTTATIKLKRVR